VQEKWGAVIFIFNLNNLTDLSLTHAHSDGQNVTFNLVDILEYSSV